jgi:riboflavin biosynthesis pyrimidine reductase
VTLLGYEAHGPNRALFEIPGVIDGLLRDKLQLREVLVEPGPTLARAFLATPRVDRVLVFRSPLRVGDAAAPGAVPVPEGLVRTAAVAVGADELVEYRKPMIDEERDEYITPVPSADLVLAAA